jgi:hypothetical protein
MKNKLKTVLVMLITLTASGITGFSCYRTGHVKGTAETTVMYEDLISSMESSTGETFEFSESNLDFMLTKFNVRFPEIVKAQVQLETGNYSSKVYRENNNLFGMKKAYRRPSTCKGMKNGHCYYDDWFDSVIDYILYQRVFLSKIDNVDDYLKVLQNSYAEDPRYAKKLRVLIKERDLNKVQTN